MLKGCRVRTIQSLRTLAKADFHFAGFHALTDDDLRPAALRPHRFLARLSIEEGLGIEPVLLTKSTDIDAILRAIDVTEIRWLQLHLRWSDRALDRLAEKLSAYDVKVIALVNPQAAGAIQQAQQLLEKVSYLIVDHDAGGTGTPLGRKHLTEFFKSVPSDRTFVAGGLGPANVTDVVKRYSPYGLDVQSGIIGTAGDHDFRLARAFRRAASSTAELAPVDSTVKVFQEYSSELWRTIDPEILNSERIIAKMNLLSTLESVTPYRDETRPIWSRIRRALEALERLDPPLDPLWRQAAVTIFANTIYLPAPMMSQTWQALHMALVENLGLRDTPREELWDKLHFFENDPSGMTTTFFHSVGLDGRLDNEKFARIESTDRLAETILNLFNPLMEDSAATSLRLLFSKPNWVLLVDKTLSGHSLIGDVKRLRLCQRALGERPSGAPKLAILAQVATQRALDELVVDGTGTGVDVDVQAAMVLDETMNLASPRCSMIKDRRILGIARELCSWFAEKLIAEDDRFDRMRKRSGDGLEFGYRGCGLTLVDHTNSPTDSLPLLWYSQVGQGGYEGPYPRVHSRIGDQKLEASASKWGTISQNEEFLDRLKSVGGGLSR